MVRVVRERIDPRLTASLFANYRSAIDAVLELVDNAIDSRIRGQTLRVELTIRPGSLALTAVGGLGMSPAQIERDYLRWGASPKKGRDRIGRYGQGGKAAIGHLGDRFTIVAGPVGDDRVYHFQDESYRDRSRLRTYELTERPKPVARELGYVRIEVGAVDKRLDASRTHGRLAEVYRPLLDAGDLEVHVNRSRVQSRPWPLEERRPVSVRVDGRLVRGWYGLLPDPPPPDVAPGIRVYHLGRLIGDPEWFGHPGPALHPGLARLVGVVELSHVPVTMNKADFDRDSDAWQAVEVRMHKLLAPVVRRLTKDAGPAASPQALRTADQVRRILARALRLLESGELFESPTAAGSDGPEGQLTLDQARVQRIEDEADQSDLAGADGPDSVEGTPPEDARPAPPKPRGGGSRRGFGDVVIRALDPRIRSAYVVEDGIRRVVINSRYQLYEVRKGDLWYQLETALREVCVAIPEATVPEFERRVNELMLVSLSLTNRRKRMRPPRPAGQARGEWSR
jgi:hypothetical protein